MCVVCVSYYNSQIFPYPVIIALTARGDWGCLVACIHTDLDGPDAADGAPRPGYLELVERSGGRAEVAVPYLAPLWNIIRAQDQSYIWTWNYYSK